MSEQTAAYSGKDTTTMQWWLLLKYNENIHLLTLREGQEMLDPRFCTQLKHSGGVTTNLTLPDTTLLQELVSWDTEKAPFLAAWTQRS